MNRVMDSARVGGWRVAVAAIAATSLALAACGSDDDSSSASTAAAATTAAAAETTAAATATSGDIATTVGDTATTSDDTATTAGDTATTSDDTATTAGDTATTAGDTATTSGSGETGEPDCPGPTASGDPVKIGVAWPEGPTINTPDVGKNAEAARLYANDCLGGIAGHPIEFVECRVDETNAASATDCANNVVEAKAAAMVITTTALGATLVPIIVGAGIPYVGVNPASPAESGDKTGLVFELSPGVAGYLAAMAQVAKDDGMTKVSLVLTENIAQGVGGLAKIPFAKAGIELNVVPVPPGTPDISAQVTSALDGAGAVGIIADPTTCISFLQATKTLDPDGKHWIIRSCAEASVVKAVGADALDKALLFGVTDSTSDNAEAVLYRAVMAKYAPDTPPGISTVAGYQSVLAFVRGLSDLAGDVTAASVAATLQATTDVALPAGGGTKYGCASRPVIPILATVCSSEVIVATMDGSTPTDPQVVDAAPLYAS